MLEQIHSFIAQLIDFLLWISQGLLKWVPLIAGIAGLFAIYRFLIRRPDLRLESEIRSITSSDSPDIIRGIPTLYLKNEGRSHAEDVYFRLHTDEWNFDPEREQDSIETVLDLNENPTEYIGAPGVLYQVFVDNTIPSGSCFRMFFGDVKFERNHTYVLEYTITCQTYGPRDGQIRYEIGHQDVDVIHKHPTKIRRFSRWFNSKVSTVMDWPSSIVTKSDHQPLAIIKKNQNIICSSERHAEIEISVENQGEERLRTVIARTEIFDGVPSSENFIKSIPAKMLCMCPGEIWDINQKVALPSKLSKDRINTRVIVEDTSEKPIEVWDGIELVESNADLADSSTDLMGVRGRVKNTNAGTDYPFYIVVKFYNEDGNSIAFESQRMTLEAGVADDFDLHPTGARDLRDRAEDCNVFLMR